MTGAAAFGFDADGDGRCDVASLVAEPGFARLRVAASSRVTDWIWRDGVTADRVPVSTRLDRLGDLDGDGYEELAVRFDAIAREVAAFAVVLHGGPDGYSLERTLPIDARSLPEGEEAPLFDVNGDGITDRIVSSSAAPAALYLGSAVGFVRSADLPRCAAPCGPVTYFSAGDYDRDGYSDLYAWNAETHALEIYAGGPSGFGAAPVETVTLDP